MTGHQHHFLSRLDRVSTDHVELALTLYRDDKLVKYLLQCAKLPDGAERVAISLDHPEEGPFLVVTRDGHFVTCLGAGMKAGDLPVLTRGHLEALTSKVTDLRARIAAAQALAGPGGETAKLLDRIYKAGAVLSREEFIAISAFQPILDLRLLHAYLGAITRLQDLRERLIKIERPKPALTPLLRAYWDTFWAIGHLAVLAFMDGRALIGGLPPELDLSDTPLSWGAVRQGICALAVRGCWAVAKVGKAQMKPSKHALDDAQTPLRLITAATALIALGVRHTKLRAEVRKALAAPYDPSRALYREELLESVRNCAGVAFDAPEHAASVQREIGARLAVGLTRHLPAGKGFRFERAEEVPEDLAMTLAANCQQEFIHSPEGVILLMVSLPWAARAEPEQFFLPRDFIRAAFPRWQPADTMDLIAPLREHYKPKGPVQREGPTRSGPCPCGSGKKYKRCCGAESK